VKLHTCKDCGWQQQQDGEPDAFTCPECGGDDWEDQDEREETETV
jgi:predicted RNA-binding Zn-ribbon protein involved in translation (DUF1610 family)